MKNLTIALLQILPGDTSEDNRQIGLTACRKAKERGADIALFPEMWSSGYHIPENEEELRTKAIDINSEFLREFSCLAAELQMAIGVTFLEAYEPLPRNTFVLFDRLGHMVLTYAKVHTCDFGDESRLTPGEDFSVADLDTAVGTVRVGAMICFDREFPESARILMLKGAEIVLVPNACPMEINRLSQLRGRAYENMMGILTCNYPLGQPDCNGHSSAFDGIAYLPELSGSRDTCIAEAGTEEEILLAEVDMDMLRTYREKEVHGNAYRHPRKYSLLVEDTINEPFIRSDYRE